MCFVLRVAVTSFWISQMLHPLFLFTRSVYSVFTEMGFSSVEKHGFLYHFVRYKCVPGLMEKGELDFCCIWINVLTQLSTIHYAEERWKKESWLWWTWGNIFWSVRVIWACFTSIADTQFSCFCASLPLFRKLDWDILNCLPQICSLSSVPCS